MKNLPTITRIPSFHGDNCRRYRVEDGEITEEWRANYEKHLEREPERPIYCEISIWFYGNTLGSYGGTVWPSAWPELFESHRGTAQSGPYTIVTPLGLELIAEAERVLQRDYCSMCKSIAGSSIADDGLERCNNCGCH